MLAGAYTGIFPVGGAYIFWFPGGVQHPLRPENPLETIILLIQGEPEPTFPPPLVCASENHCPTLSLLKKSRSHFYGETQIEIVDFLAFSILLIQFFSVGTIEMQNHFIPMYVLYINKM